MRGSPRRSGRALHLGVQGRAWAFVQTVTACLTVACGQPEPAREVDPSTGRAALGTAPMHTARVWVVSQTETSTQAGASFLRSRHPDTPSLRQVIDGLPLLANEVALDSCQAVDLPRTLSTLFESAAASNASAVLLDAGDLTLWALGPRPSGGGAPTTLRPGPFPDLLPFLGGVAYTGALAPPLADAASVLVTSSGTEDVAPFSVRAPWPRPPQAAVQPSAGDTTWSLRWAPGGPGEPTELLITVIGADGLPRQRCRARDDGEFELRALGAWLDVGRLSRQSFTLPEFDFAELWLEARSRLTLPPR
jgi:hypothetical protein